MLLNCEFKQGQINIFGTVLTSPEMKVRPSEAAASQQNGIQQQVREPASFGFPDPSFLNDVGSAPGGADAREGR